MVRLAVVAAMVCAVLAVGAQAAPRWLVLRHPIDPHQELGLGFGTRSQWLQPWRGYLDTPPASAINHDLGINFNVSPADANATAAALQRAGFRRARVEIGWGEMSYGNSGEFSPAGLAQTRTILTALFRHHLRPLIVLNANQGLPVPLQSVNLHVILPAPRGSRQVVLDSASARQVVPGRTGFNSLTGGYKAASVMITSMVGPLATLSAPLPRPLSPGNYGGSTLAYAPFTAPSASLSAAHASFADTEAGWLDYVDGVASLARQLGHGDDFDVEVWNEVTFGSDFLNINNYYSPPVDTRGPASGADSATDQTLLAATASLIHKRFPGVQVGDGFSDEVPWTSGQTELPGVEIDKHYYSGKFVYPRDDGPIGVKPVDWLGRTFARYTKVNGSDDWVPFWTPSYTTYFPEYWLSGLKTETLIRDLTPLKGESIYGSPHGRNTHPKGAPPPKIWMTEYNLDRYPTPALSGAQEQRLQAKVALRYLLAFINKGLGLVDFYAAEGGGLALLPDSFYAAIGKASRPNPGLTLTALGRMTHFLHVARRMRRRSVTLLQVSTTDHRKVFNGSGRYPPLRNLDVAAFFSFQEATHRFVFAAYVMTRNLLRTWRKPGARQYDMPAGTYRFEVGGIDGCTTKLSATDPLTGDTVPVRRVACTKRKLTLQTRLTDSPILIQASGA